MANVKLSRSEAEKGDLLPLCARCGAPAKLIKARKLTWRKERVNVRIPFCSAHQYHWFWRDWLKGGGLAALLFVYFAGWCIGLYPIRVGGFACLLCSIFGIFWFIASLILDRSAIRLIDVTPSTITLTNVSSEFADALQSNSKEVGKDE